MARLDCLALALVLCVSHVTCNPLGPNLTRPVWQEEFNVGRLDTEKWEVKYGYPTPIQTIRGGSWLVRSLEPSYITIRSTEEVLQPPGGRVAVRAKLPNAGHMAGNTLTISLVAACPEGSEDCQEAPDLGDERIRRSSNLDQGESFPFRLRLITLENSTSMSILRRGIIEQEDGQGVTHLGESRQPLSGGWHTYDFMINLDRNLIKVGVDNTTVYKVDGQDGLQVPENAYFDEPDQLASRSSNGTSYTSSPAARSDDTNVQRAAPASGSFYIELTIGYEPRDESGVDELSPVAIDWIRSYAQP